MHGHTKDRSPDAAADYPMIMGVRTHCSTVLVHVQIYHSNKEQDNSEQHAEPPAYHIVMETVHEHVPANYATLEFSPGLPTAMCLSPFNESEYAMMTENGYLSIFDVRNTNRYSIYRQVSCIRYWNLIYIIIVITTGPWLQHIT